MSTQTKTTKGTTTPTLVEKTNNTTREKAVNPRFLVVKKMEGDFSTTSPFLIAKVLYGLVGDVKDVKKIRGGLLIETVSNVQANRLLAIQRFNNEPVEITAHETLNFSKGVITCSDLLNCTLEEIMEELKDEGVVDVKRITTRRNGFISSTASIILTFNTPTLPKYIKVAFYRLSIRPYIPQPLRCFRCQGYGHTATNCTKKQICVCGNDIHDGTPCETPITCVNCQGQHSARAKICPKYLEEIAIQKIKVTEKVSYQEARKKVILNTPTHGVSYARAVNMSSQLNSATIVNALIPEIKNICESLLEKLKKQSTENTHTESEHTVCNAENITLDDTFKTPNNPAPSSKRKKDEQSSAPSTPEEEVEMDTDLDNELEITEKEAQILREVKKKKRGWQKGRPRKVDATRSDSDGEPLTQSTSKAYL